MENLKVYKCNICGNIVLKLEDVTEALVCCGEQMELLEVQTVEGLGEKHLPVFEKEELNEGTKYSVTVGEVLHPMEEKHYINFIIVQTKKGYDVKFLKPGDEPKAKFIENDEVVAIYEYCNLHGLWKVEL